MQLQEFIKNIADTLKVDATKLTEALNSKEDITLELPKLKTFTEDEYSQLNTNLKKEGYDEGKTAGTEMNTKTIKKIFGIDAEGKDLTKIAEAIKSKIKAEAKIEPNRKLQELEQSIINLQKTVTDKETELTNFKTKYSKEQLEHKITSLIPANSIGLDNKTILSDMRSNGYDVSEVDGKMIVTKNGETLKDNLQNPLSFDVVANQYLTEKKWIDVNKDGRGGGDNAGGDLSNTANIKSFADYQEYAKNNNIDVMSEEGKALLIEAREANKF